MISAVEAAKISKEKQTRLYPQDFDRINEYVIKAANEGRFFVSIMFDHEVALVVLDTLRTLGFEATLTLGGVFVSWDRT